MAAGSIEVQIIGNDALQLQGVGHIDKIYFLLPYVLSTFSSRSQVPLKLRIIHKLYIRALQRWCLTFV